MRRCTYVEALFRYKINCRASACLCELITAGKVSLRIVDFYTRIRVNNCQDFV
jgi:hypothetical protein